MKYVVWGLLALLAITTGIYTFVDANLPFIGPDTECFLQSAGTFVLIVLGMILIGLIVYGLVRFIVAPLIERLPDWIVNRVNRVADHISYEVPDWAKIAIVIIIVWIAMAFVFYSNECGGE